MSLITNTVLSSFHNDDVGMLCRTDPMITVVGKILWERSVRQEKRTTMGEMRKLGTRLKAAKDISEKDDFTGTDMLHPTNFRTVVEALNFITAKEDNSIEAGLKLSLGYLLKKAARFTKCKLIIDGKDEEVKETNFCHCLMDHGDTCSTHPKYS